MFVKGGYPRPKQDQHKDVLCYGCRLPGHVIANCRKSGSSRVRARPPRAPSPKRAPNNDRRGYKRDREQESFIAYNNSSFSSQAFVQIPPESMTSFGILDTGCMSNVCGITWPRQFETVLQLHRPKIKLERQQSSASFAFGGGKATACVKILLPVVFMGNKGFLRQKLWMTRRDHIFRC